MIKVTEAGKKGCTIEIAGPAELLCKEYVALTLRLTEVAPQIIATAGCILSEVTNDKTDINNN